MQSLLYQRTMNLCTAIGAMDSDGGSVSCGGVQYPFIQAVDIEVLDLGSLPPAIGGAKTYTSSADEAILEAPIMWGSDMRVRVAVRIKLGPYVLYVPLEVSNVQVGPHALPRALL